MVLGLEVLHRRVHWDSVLLAPTDSYATHNSQLMPMVQHVETHPPIYKVNSSGITLIVAWLKGKVVE